MNPYRLAQFAYRSACAVAVLAQLESIPQEGVTVFATKLGHHHRFFYTLQVHLNACQQYEVRSVHSTARSYCDCISTHSTLSEALNALAAVERSYYDCEEDERQGAIEALREQGYFAG